MGEAALGAHHALIPETLTPWAPQEEPLDALFAVTALQALARCCCQSVTLRTMAARHPLTARLAAAAVAGMEKLPMPGCTYLLRSAAVLGLLGEGSVDGEAVLLRLEALLPEATSRELWALLKWCAMPPLLLLCPPVGWSAPIRLGANTFESCGRVSKRVSQAIRHVR